MTKTNLGKCLVVLIACASTAFIATVTVVVQSGKNWEGIAKSNENYSITRTEGSEAVTYQATDRITLESVGQPGILPEKIIAAMQAHIKKMQGKTADNKKLIESAESDTAQYNKLVPIAKAALNSQIESYRQELAQIDQENEQLSKEIVKLTTEANEVLTDATHRRGDVTRLRSQLDEIRTEIFRLSVQRDKLADQLVRYQETINTLKRRNQQLQGQTRTAAVQ